MLELFTSTIRLLDSDNLVSIPQDETKALYCHPRKPQDSKINWKDSSENILRLIRVFSKPFDGTFCYLEKGQKLIIFIAESYPCLGEFCAVPGQILFAIEQDPVIACGGGAIILKDLQVEAIESVQESKSIILKSLRNRLA